jgi:hypothetical protein
MSNPPPELANYIENAYNAKDGNFLSLPVFALTYTKGQTVNWGSGQRDIPDAVSASAASQFYSRQTSVLMEDQADYDRLYSASVNAEYSGVSWSGSVQSSFLYHGNMFSSTSSTYALNSFAQSVLTFERRPITAAALTSEFAAALSALPVDISTSPNQAAYFAFFDSYGTHYAQYGTMGGTVVMETEIDDSVFESTTAIEVSASLSVGYQGIVASGKMDVSAAYKSSDFLYKHRNDIRISLNVMGGLYSPDESIAAWQQSIYNSPSLLLNVPNQMKPALTQLRCVSNLVGLVSGLSATVATNIEQLLPAYLTPAYFADGMLGSPRNIAFAQVKQAALGDGFLFGTIQQTNNGDRGYLQGFNDDTANPSVQRACASQHWYMQADDWIGSASMMMPMPKGSYYTATTQTTSGEPQSSLNFVAFGNIDATCFGDWQNVAVNTPIQAPCDGFVVASIDWAGQDGARGTIIGSQWASGATPNAVAGSSQHYYSGSDIIVPTNSFCMPVTKGINYKVALNQTSGTPKGAAYFVPMQDGVAALGGFQQRQAGRTYQAQTDGFLLAFLNANNDGDRGQINLFSYANVAELTKLGMLGSTSMHFYTGSDTWVPCNSVTIPVSQGNFYTANYMATSGNPAVSLLWVPVARSKSVTKP